MAAADRGVIARGRGHQGERHVDAGGHAGGGDDLPLPDDALLDLPGFP